MFLAQVPPVAWLIMVCVLGAMALMGICSVRDHQIYHREDDKARQQRKRVCFECGRKVVSRIQIPHFYCNVCKTL